MSKNIPLLFLSLFLFAGYALADNARVKVIGLFTNKALLQIDGERKLLSTGEVYKGIYLESASARGAEIRVDGEIQKLRINQSIGRNFKAPQRTVSRIYPDNQGMYYTPGQINRRPVRFLVDTGASHVTLSGDTAKKVGVDFREGIRSMAQTASELIVVWQVRLNTVSIGDIVINNIDATVIEGGQPYDVLLGNSFLTHTRMRRVGAIMELEKRF